MMAKSIEGWQVDTLPGRLWRFAILRLQLDESRSDKLQDDVVSALLKKAKRTK